LSKRLQLSKLQLTKRLQRGATGYTHPLWLRGLALACLLLVAGASTAQATHIHGQWLPHQSAQVGGAADGSQLPGGEERCPLCVAMHSALPASVSLQPVEMVLVECRPVTVVEHSHDAQWHFAMFSRPPPVVTL
jgi:hypothetical protein